ncbi:MAG: hypothetical protein ORO03_05225 [Alphaproteobacteria bacterium]|nr:hypothetical protein [Alphaproteobacteria bacterium]
MTKTRVTSDQKPASADENWIEERLQRVRDRRLKKELDSLVLDDVGRVEDQKVPQNSLDLLVDKSELDSNSKLSVQPKNHNPMSSLALDSSPTKPQRAPNDKAIESNQDSQKQSVIQGAKLDERLNTVDQKLVKTGFFSSWTVKDFLTVTIAFLTIIGGTVTYLTLMIHHSEDRLDRKIDQVEQKLMTKIDSVDTRLSAEIKSVNERLNGMDTRLNGIDTRLNSIDANLSKTNAMLEILVGQRSKK